MFREKEKRALAYHRAEAKRIEYEILKARKEGKDCEELQEELNKHDFECDAITVQEEGRRETFEAKMMLLHIMIQQSGHDLDELMRERDSTPCRFRSLLSKLADEAEDAALVNNVTMWNLHFPTIDDLGMDYWQKQ